MYNSSVCYKHKGHKHEVERAPHPTDDYTPPAWMWPFALFESLNYWFWAIIAVWWLNMAIKWVF